jgi:hypothetical protein
MEGWNCLKINQRIFEKNIPPSPSSENRVTGLQLQCLRAFPAVTKHNVIGCN